MDDTPYTTPDEDPFSARSIPQQPRRRRSSLLDRWIKDQQTDQATSTTDALIQHDALPRDDDLTNNYDLLDDDDIPSNRDETSTPTIRRSRRASRLLNAPSPFRVIPIPFRLSDAPSPRPASRLSFFSRGSRRSPSPSQETNAALTHQRSFSASTLDHNRRSHISLGSSGATLSTKWRPSVLGHFSTSSASQTSVVPSDTAYTPSRPSVSSADTFTSTSITTSYGEQSIASSKPDFMSSLRSQNHSRGSIFKNSSAASTPSSFRPRPRPNEGHARANSDTSARQLESCGTTFPSEAAASSVQPQSHDAHYLYEHEADPDSVKPQPPPTRPQIAYASNNHLSRVHFPSISSRNQKKKKKLVVSGVGHNDARKFEGVKRWCESFGEVSQITRMPNGDLHVHFRLAEVADTVCRLRARVYIAGVGSVQLSCQCLMDGQAVPIVTFFFSNNPPSRS